MHKIFPGEVFKGEETLYDTGASSRCPRLYAGDNAETASISLNMQYFFNDSLRTFILVYLDKSGQQM